MSQVFPKKAGILVAHQNILKASGGGVQICHREYAATLEAAGFSVRSVPYDFSGTFVDRAVNRLLPKVQPMSEPSGLFEKVTGAVSSTNAEFVFFEWSSFPGVSSKLRQARPAVRQVLLSHGVEGLDFCIDQRLRRAGNTENRLRMMAERMLGNELLYEAEQRRWLDAVLTVSPFEVEIEKWLGARRAIWVPRTVSESPLPMAPIDQMVGCVSTLDHPPNLDGLVQLLDALRDNVTPEFRFRLVGAPTTQGTALVRRYPFLDYLGPLSDAELRTETATWCCFVHPIFVYSKGYSTKLAIALGWGLPIATTEFGARGYLWDTQLVPLAGSPAELVRLVMDRCTVNQFKEHEQKTKNLRAKMPQLSTVGDQIRTFLESDF